jgi:hypothetical protein
MPSHNAKFFLLDRSDEGDYRILAFLFGLPTD